jgi:very-short-patch-repair endonuclease
VRVGGFEVDFLWRERRLIVETDGFRHHRTRRAFERDRARRCSGITSFASLTAS